MIPCPRLPIFLYSPLKNPTKSCVLAGHIEGVMPGKLTGFKVTAGEVLQRTNDQQDEALGEMIWIDLTTYDNLIFELDNYLGEPLQYHRTICQALTNEATCKGGPPVAIKCWTYLAANPSATATQG
jgi:hypothetical protein